MRRRLRRCRPRTVPPRLVALVLVLVLVLVLDRLDRLVLLMLGRHGIAAVQKDRRMGEHFGSDLLDHPAHIDVLAPLQGPGRRRRDRHPPTNEEQAVSRAKQGSQPAAWGSRAWNGMRARGMEGGGLRRRLLTGVGGEVSLRVTYDSLRQFAAACHVHRLPAVNPTPRVHKPTIASAQVDEGAPRQQDRVSARAQGQGNRPRSGRGYFVVVFVGVRTRSSTQLCRARLPTVTR